ncbi:MAG: class I SAM-dependent methyltransferase, partial [Candidatus Magasanikbacteria bacterium]
MSEQKTLGWGITNEEGAEIWDDSPLFNSMSMKEKLMLVFYPKKFVLYRAIKKYKKEWGKTNKGKIFRVLDVGCGTGSSVIDLKRYLGDTTIVAGIDVVSLQIEIAKRKASDCGVDVEFLTYDGIHIPYESEFFDVVYSSDVLGHVENVPAWLDEIKRVLKFEGLLAMFSESKLGKHAYIRKYLFARGLNTDPHKEYHISLYSKDELKKMFFDRNFFIERMYSTVWAKMMVH